MGALGRSKRVKVLARAQHNGSLIWLPPTRLELLMLFIKSFNSIASLSLLLKFLGKGPSIRLSVGFYDTLASAIKIIAKKIEVYI